MSTQERYECPPFDLHLELPTEQMAQRHLERLHAHQRTAPPGPGWPVWYFRHGRRIYSQIQVPIHLRAPRRDWALETLIRLQEAGIIPHPYATPTVPSPAGPQHILF